MDKKIEKILKSKSDNELELLRQFIRDELKRRTHMRKTIESIATDWQDIEIDCSEWE